jgi:hypothetical protein
MPERLAHSHALVVAGIGVAYALIRRSTISVDC